MTAAVLLRSAAETIKTQGWCRKSAGENDGLKLGLRTTLDLVRAGMPCTVCVSTAIGCHAPDDVSWRSALEAFRAHTGTFAVTGWNDAPTRTQEQVVAALLEAAALQESGS